MRVSWAGAAVDWTDGGLMEGSCLKFLQLGGFELSKNKGTSAMSEFKMSMLLYRGLLLSN